MTILLRQKPLPQVVRQIVQRDNGAWFDPEDLSTMFQDAAGTVPVTAVGQPVGLVLDKSQGLMLGLELQPSGDFYGFSSRQTDISYNSSGFTTTIAGRGVVKQMLVVGRFYEISINATSTTTFSVNTTDSFLPTMRTELRVGNGTTKFLATSEFIYIRNYDVGTTTINLLTIRELYGNHATQPITASRPTLIYENGMYGLQFDGIDDYLNLPYMGLYAGGACSVVAAVDSVAQATDGHLISERSTASANQKYILSRRLASDGIDSLITNDANTIVKDTNGTTSELRTKTVRSIIDNGQNINIYKEGVLSGHDDYTRSGTLTLNTTTIGASVSTTTTNFMNFKLFGLIVTKSALNDTQRLQCEKYLGRKVNVPI